LVFLMCHACFGTEFELILISQPKNRIKAPGMRQGLFLFE
jgi:hypothetical protein